MAKGGRLGEGFCSERMEAPQQAKGIPIIGAIQVIDIDSNKSRQVKRQPSRKAGGLERGLSGLGGGFMKPSSCKTEKAHDCYPHPVQCPPYPSTEVRKVGKQANGLQRYQ